ncbi:hypothetical protein DL93DRAFT_2072456, partial [Clavulina sp. PMI_390]
MGGHGDQAESEKTLIEAASDAKVKVYFNSDFGSDYDKETWGTPGWEAKKAHASAARALGLKTVSIANGVFMPFLRTPFLGVKDGYSSFALIDMSDAGRYTLRAILLASLIVTLNEYASIVQRLTNVPITKKYVPRPQLIAEWETPNAKNEKPLLFLRIMAGTSAANFLGHEHNELLNPGQKYFKPLSFEEAVKV